MRERAGSAQDILSRCNAWQKEDWFTPFALP